MLMLYRRRIDGLCSWPTSIFTTRTPWRRREAAAAVTCVHARAMAQQQTQAPRANTARRTDKRKGFFMIARRKRNALSQHMRAGARARQWCVNRQAFVRRAGGRSRRRHRRAVMKSRAHSPASHGWRTHLSVGFRRDLAGRVSEHDQRSLHFDQFNVEPVLVDHTNEAARSFQNAL